MSMIVCLLGGIAAGVPLVYLASEFFDIGDKKPHTNRNANTEKVEKVVKEDFPNA